MSEMDDTLLQCARLMEMSARTAPKSGGKDYVVLRVLDGEKTRELGERMVKLGGELDKAMYVRDGKSVGAAGAVLLVGIREAAAVGLNCEACGFETCEEMRQAREEAGDDDVGECEGIPCFQGPNCAFRMLDMGIALGSAARTAQMLNADNRIMYRAGIVAMSMGLIEADFVMAIPVAATGKSVFFDR